MELSGAAQRSAAPTHMERPATLVVVAWLSALLQSSSAYPAHTHPLNAPSC